MGPPTHPGWMRAGSHDGCIRLFDCVSGACTAVVEAGACVRDLSWHPELPLLVAAAWDGTVTAWERGAHGRAVSVASAARRHPAAAGGS